jgi:DNA-binding NarL/FixJ family response regulator
MIRLCLVDDQALIRSGIRALLGLFEDFSVVAEAGDGSAAIDAVLASKPDVLLLDVRMPKLTGVEVISALAARNALPPTLLLTTFDDDAALVAGLRAGALGYLLKGVTPEILVEAIRTAAAGGRYLYAPMTAPKPRRAEAAWMRDVEPEPEPLTDRETEILRLMTSGISNREIAQALELGEGTVRNHISNIFSKFGVGDRTKAVLYAMQRGLV